MKTVLIAILMTLGTVAAAHEKAPKLSLSHRLLAKVDRTFLAKKKAFAEDNQLRSKITNHLVRMAMDRNEDEVGLWEITHGNLYEGGTYGHELAKGRFADVALYAAGKGPLPIVTKTKLSITEVPFSDE